MGDRHRFLNENIIEHLKMRSSSQISNEMPAFSSSRGSPSLRDAKQATGRSRYLSPSNSKMTLPNIKKQHVDNGKGVMSGTFYTIRQNQSNPFN